VSHDLGYIYMQANPNLKSTEVFRLLFELLADTLFSASDSEAGKESAAGPTGMDEPKQSVIVGGRRLEDLYDNSARNLKGLRCPKEHFMKVLQEEIEHGPSG